MIKKTYISILRYQEMRSQRNEGDDVDARYALFNDRYQCLVG